MLENAQEKLATSLTKTEEYTNMVLSFATEYGMKVLIALAIFFIGKWVSRQIVKLMRRGMERASVDATLISFSGNVVYVVLVIAVVVAALSRLGVDTSSFIAVFGAAGLAIGLALKDTLANVGAAVLIIFFRPFKVDDSIEVSGVIGTVKSINLFSTTLTTADNRSIIIPNGTLVAGNIINNTGNATRRIDLVMDIGYQDDLKVAKEIIAKTLKSHSKVLKEPDFTVAVGALAPSSVQLYVRPWVASEDYWDVRFELTEQIKLIFDEYGITVPFPQMDLHVHKEAVKIEA